MKLIQNRIIFLLLLLLSKYTYSQMVVDAPAVESILTTINGVLAESESSQLVTKSETIKNVLNTAESLEKAKEMIKKLNKVSNFIKKGKKIKTIYDVEKRIISKATNMSSNVYNSLDNSDASKISSLVLKATGEIVDKAVQIITDDLFSMDDFQRENFLDTLLSKLYAIEDILNGKIYQNKNLDNVIKNNDYEKEKNSEYIKILKDRRSRINKM